MMGSLNLLNRSECTAPEYGPGLNAPEVLLAEGAYKKLLDRKTPVVERYLSNLNNGMGDFYIGERKAKIRATERVLRERAAADFQNTDTQDLITMCRDFCLDEDRSITMGAYMGAIDILRSRIPADKWEPVQIQITGKRNPKNLLESMVTFMTGNYPDAK